MNHHPAPVAQPASDRELQGEVIQRRAIPANETNEDDPPLPEAGSVVFEGLLEEILTIENSIPGCVDYEGMLTLREILGSVAKPSQLNRDIQTARERRSISPDQYATLGKAWQRCNRQLEKLEKKGFPANVLDTHRDE